MSEALPVSMAEVISMAVSEPAAAFTTHANYLHAIDKVIAAYVPKPHGLGPTVERVVACLIPAVHRSRVLAALQPKPAEDTDQVARILTNAWGTELLLNATGDIAADELIGFSNNWSVIQAYYAAYHAIQAVLVARGDKRPEKHSTTQRQFTAFWVDRRTDLLPWSLGWDDSGAINLPRGYTLHTVHNWENCHTENCIDFLAKGLKTTREDLVTQRLSDERRNKQARNRKQWESEEATRLADGRRPRKRPSFPSRLGADERDKVATGVKATSVLDYLYRLRVRSNYEDSTMFTEGPTDPIQSWSVYRELSSITCATMLVHELLVIRIIGGNKVRSMMEHWLHAAKRPQKSGLFIRYNALKSSGGFSLDP